MCDLLYYSMCDTMQQQSQLSSPHAASSLSVCHISAAARPVNRPHLQAGSSTHQLSLCTLQHVPLTQVVPQSFAPNHAPAQGGTPALLTPMKPDMFARNHAQRSTGGYESSSPEPQYKMRALEVMLATRLMPALPPSMPCLCSCCATSSGPAAVGRCNGKCK